MIKRSRSRTRGRNKRKTRSNHASKKYKINLEKQLNNINKAGILKYKYVVNFTDEPEYNELISENNLDKIKIKLDNYIDMVKKSVLYPSEYLKKFKLNYVAELEKIKEKLKGTSKMKRKDSFEEIESNVVGMKKYKHYKNPKISKYTKQIGGNIKEFLIIDSEEE